MAGGSKRHKIWPVTVITLVLVWIAVITVLIHNGAR